MKTVKQKQIHIGPVTQAVLGVIAVAGVISLAVCAPNALQILKPFFKKKKYSPQQSVKRNIESLIRTGLVEKSIDTQGNVILRLTRRGSWENLIRTSNPLHSKKKWDGQWRIVIFDVPNTKEKLRLELRRGMGLYGFHLLQKSVWVYPYACDEFVTLLRDHLELSENVLYFTVSNIENSKELRKEFQI